MSEEIKNIQDQIAGKTAALTAVFA